MPASKRSLVLIPLFRPGSPLKFPVTECRSGLVGSRLLWIFVLVFLPFLAQADVVKKSSSGICHATDSPYYDTVKRYKVFASLDNCVRSGGRSPVRSSHEPDRMNGQAYTRDLFGEGWADEDGDCQNTRMEVLIEQSTLPVRFSAGRRCRVVYGRWISAFTGEVVQNGAEIQIDHLVPLKWAWDRGAQSWPQAKREQFANDPINLLPVEAHLNVPQKVRRGRTNGCRLPVDVGMWLVS